MIIPKRRKPEPMGLREETRVRNAGHLAWVRGHTCIGEGKSGHECEGKTEAHHVRTGTDGAAGIKPGDNYAVPCCSAFHRTIHDIGETTAEMRYGINMLAIAAALWRKSPHRRKSED